jgi:tRNA A-37 threonylcarbamoyl transferase component Bud32
MKNCPTCQGSYPNSFAVCPQDGTGLVEVGAWSDGALVRGKYRILAKVGQGGMGAVYKALHLAFDELRALKVISTELVTDELFVKRFKHEAVITRKLQHPHAVRVEDIDEAEDGRPFIVMEYIEGRSLKKLIQDEGPLPVPRVCTIIKQAASALDAAHHLGMVHRDIKPDNIVLVETPEGEQAKVLDFGIAKIKEARLGGEAAGMTLTGAGVVIGTPQYMSPEQAMGKRGDELDGRSDLYSLGIVMYQMLTGDLPFKADTTMGMLLAQMQTAPTPIGALHADLQIPPSIARLVMKTLEKKPELRPASAEALIEEINRAEKDTAPVGPTRVTRPMPMAPHRPLEAKQAAASGYAGAAEPTAPPTAGVAEARPAALEPAAQVSPRQPAPPQPAAALRDWRWALWVSTIILAAGLGGGTWYVSAHRTVSEPKSPPAETPLAVSAPPNSVSSASPPAATATPSSTPSADAQSPGRPQPETVPVNTAPDSIHPPVHSTTVAGRQPASLLTHRPNRSAPVETPPAKPAVDPEQLSAAIRLGDFYFGRGDYDNAIAEYQKGLSLDPTDPDLRARLDRVKKAKAAEARVLQ